MKYLIPLLLFTTATFANGNSHHHEEAGPQGEQGIQGEVGPQGPAGANGIDGVAGIAGLNSINSIPEVNNSKLYTGMASAIALANIDFSSSTSHWQIGIGAGTYEGRQAMAFGVGKLVTKYDMLFKASGTVSSEHTGVGVGLMWKIQ